MFNVRYIPLWDPPQFPFLFVVVALGPVKGCAVQTVTGSRALSTYLDLGTSWSPAVNLLLLHQIFY